jgi:hypothetical protein
MNHCIPMVHGEIQIQTLTHGYQDCLVPDVFQNVMSKLVDLLILTNNSFKDHLFKIEMVQQGSQLLG